MDPMEQIGQRIWKKLRNRLAAETAGDTANVDGFDRVLALWIDLRRAIHLFGDSQCLEPWRNPHREIQDAWAAITESCNAIALETLFLKMQDEPQISLARRALEIAREKSVQLTHPL